MAVFPELGLFQSWPSKFVVELGRLVEGSVQLPELLRPDSGIFSFSGEGCTAGFLNETRRAHIFLRVAFVFD